VQTDDIQENIYFLPKRKGTLNGTLNVYELTIERTTRTLLLVCSLLKIEWTSQDGSWKNVLWTDEIKIDILGFNEKLYIWRKNTLRTVL